MYLIKNNKLSIIVHTILVQAIIVQVIISNKLIDLLRKSRPSNKNLLFLVHAPGVD